MENLYEDPDFYNRKAEAAKIYIKEKLSMNNAVSLIEKRMEEIYD